MAPSLELPIGTQECGIVELIIGCDQPKAHWALELWAGQSSQPFGIKTPLGWVVFGPTHAQARKALCYMEASALLETETIENMVKALYNQEFHDLDCTHKEPPVNELEAVGLVQQGTSKGNHGYTVPLPWEGYPSLSQQQGICDQVTV